MTRIRRSVVALVSLATAAVLASCAPTLVYETRSGYGPPPAPALRPSTGLAPSLPPPPPAQPPVTGVEGLAALRGWSEEDHAAALAAFQKGCGVAQAPAMQAVCARARALGPAPEVQARRFFETSFRAEPLAGEGVLTGYFAPEYPARTVADPDFSAAVRPRPADLTVSAPGPGDAAGHRLVRQVGDDGESWIYPDRAGIELTPPVQALAWMRPQDLFFMQVQGSGILDMPDGRRLRAVYAADNGRPFVPIASAMVRRGLLRPEQASATAIRAWLESHRDGAQPVMDIDPRYVFFTLEPDDGTEPAGAAGMKLTAGRSIAVDPAWHSYGELCWIDGVAPVLAGAPRTYRRLAMALDTGSAIKGAVRADLYIGRGEAAGLEAGRIRHTLRIIRLVPIGGVALGGGEARLP